MSEVAERPDQSWRGRDLFVLLPSLVAVSLGLLYATGAIIKSGQLHDAQVNIRDTLPLVPLEQLLALGIGALAASPTAVLVWVGVFLLYFGMLRPSAPRRVLRSGSKPRTVTAAPTWSTKLSELSLPLYFLAIAITALAVFPTSLAIPAVAALSFYPIIKMYQASSLRGRRYVACVVLTWFAVVMAAQLVTAYYWPQPLPSVQLTMNSGKRQQGTLIATTGSTWYVSARADTFQAISATRVASAVVTSRKRPKDHTPLESLWDKVR
jgi:hypothetical protein